MSLFDSNFKDRIIASYADAHCKEIAKQVIKALQHLGSDDLLSDDDSGFENAWEVICAQMRHEVQVSLAVFEGVMGFYIQKEVDALADHEKMAIWWQTDSPDKTYGDEDEDIEGFTHDPPAIVDYIRDAYILPAASTYGNKRI